MAQKPPSMVTYGRIEHIIKKIKHAKTPERFTNDFLREVIGAKGTNDRAFISLAKRCGLLNQDASPTERYKKLRSTNKNTSQHAMAKAIKQGYEDIYALNEYAHKLNSNDLEGLVLQLTGLEKGNATVSNIVKTFEALKKHANFDVDQEDETSKSKGDDAEDDLGASTVQSDLNSNSNLNLGLSYQINLILPKTDDIAVFNAIFRSLKENLLRK